MSLGIFQSVGVWEIMLLLLVLLLVFGPKRLPEMGRSLGRGMREFKESITGHDLELEQEAEETAAALAQTAVTPQAAPQAASAAATPQPAEPAPEPAPAPAAEAPAEQDPPSAEQSS